MIELVQLSTDDGVDIYEMLQRIKSNENEFKNSAYGLSYGEYRNWLIEQDNWSKGLNLPSGYVGQTVFWLYDGDLPVGFGKIRHELTPDSRLVGGNIGYAVDPLHRNKGYGTVLLRKLLDQAEKMGIKEKLLTVEKYNPASKAVIKKNGGKLVRESSERWYFEF